MADALMLLIGGSHTLWVLAFGSISVLLQVFIPYVRYVRVLKWLTLALFTYVGTVFTINIPWSEVLHALLLPQIQMSPAYLTTLVAIFGTTISPYLFSGRPRRKSKNSRQIQMRIHCGARRNRRGRT